MAESGIPIPSVPPIVPTVVATVVAPGETVTLGLDDDGDAANMSVFDAQGPAAVAMRRRDAVAAVVQRNTIRAPITDFHDSP